MSGAWAREIGRASRCQAWETDDVVPSRTCRRRRPVPLLAQSLMVAAATGRTLSMRPVASEVMPQALAL